jgi:hypothetical protein
MKSRIAVVLLCVCSLKAIAHIPSAEHHFIRTVHALAWCIEKVGENIPMSFDEEGICEEKLDSMWGKSVYRAEGLGFRLDHFEAIPSSLLDVGSYRGCLQTQFKGRPISAQVEYVYSGEDITGSVFLMADGLGCRPKAIVR